MSRTAALIASLLLLTMPAAVPAQAPAPSEAGDQAPPAVARGAGASEVAARLAGIETSLGRIVDLLGDSLDQQLVSVLMRRIELKERSLEPLRKALADAVSERDSLQEDRKRLKDIGEVMRRGEPDETEPDDSAEKSELEHLRREMDRMSERLSVLDQRIVEMEVDLGQRRDDIVALEQMVDERIGLR